MNSMPSTTATVLVSSPDEADRFLPEGPRNVILNSRPALVWVNIQTSTDATRGAIHWRFWDNGEQSVLPQPSRPAFILPTDVPNVIFVGREKEVGLLNLMTGDWQFLAKIPDANPKTMINDGEVVPGGAAVVFGTKDVHVKDKIAELYLFTFEDRQITTLKTGQTCSNGKVFTHEADGLILYDIDTPTHHVARYRLDLTNRRVSDQRVAVDLKEIAGAPDGMVGCGDESVIIAMYDSKSTGAGHARRFSLKTGKQVEEWVVPGSPRVTCPLLVEHSRRAKVVFTTATEGMPAAQRDQCPDAGYLFIADANLPAAPAEVLVGAAKYWKSF